MINLYRSQNASKSQLFWGSSTYSVTIFKPSETGMVVRQQQRVYRSSKGAAAAGHTVDRRIGGDWWTQYNSLGCSQLLSTSSFLCNQYITLAVIMASSELSSSNSVQSMIISFTQQERINFYTLLIVYLPYARH